METADTSRAGIAKVDRSRLHPRRCKPGNRGREAMQHRYAFASAVVAALMSLQCGVVHALSIDLPLGDDLRLSGTLNTTVTAGVAMRMESRSRSLIGKANNDPGVCGRVDANGPQRIHYQRPEKTTSEIQTIMRIAYAVFRWKKKTK